jgi:hypothetical protein
MYLVVYVVYLQRFHLNLMVFHILSNSKLKQKRLQGFLNAFFYFGDETILTTLRNIFLQIIPVPIELR